MQFAERMARLSQEQRLSFYEALAHNLTVAIRGIWSDPSTTDAEKVERIKWVNEILHRATAKVSVLRRQTHEWTEEAFGSDVRHYVGLCEGIRDEVFAAINYSYRSTTGEEI
jgi:hypothetical protein